MEYNSFEDVPVCQKAMDLAVRIFNLTEHLPRKEDYGLTFQIRDSSLKVGYFDKKEYKNCSKLIEETWKELNSLINSLSRNA